MRPRSRVRTGGEGEEGAPGRRSGLRRVARGALGLLLVLGVGSAAQGLVRDDRFLAGYAAAVVEKELGLVVSEVVVTQGRARVVVRDLEGESADRVAQVVARIEGIERVEVAEVDADPDAVGEATSGAEAPAEGEDAEHDGRGVELFPRHELFDPLLADPRQPHFSAIYQWYLDDEELTHVGSANFGETFALLGGPVGDARWELGLLGGVFSIFDLDAASSDLVNSDFWVGPTLSMRKGRFSSQLRLYHQSSHLGDEFLLRTRVDRVNLSYEGVDLLLSADVHPALRIYGGGGVIFHSEPDLDPLSVQAGAELRSPVTFLGDIVRPLAAFDFQAREENHWHGDYGAAAGIELSNPDVTGLRLMILGTWFKGNSPNGQFFERRIETLGVGTHLFF